MSHLRFKFLTRTRSICCACYGKPVSHQRKTLVQVHVDSKGHNQACKTWKPPEQKHAERAEGTPTPRVSVLLVDLGGALARRARAGHLL